jgi:hypothetical protein
MNKKITPLVIWGLVTIIVLSVGWSFFMEKAVVVFEPPERQILTYMCDNDGLRRAEVYRLDGNAVTNTSIHVSVRLGCRPNQGSNEKVAFSIDDSSVADGDVSINWVAIDTLAVEYKRGLKVFTRLEKLVYPDSTLNLTVIYREIE